MTVRPRCLVCDAPDATGEQYPRCARCQRFLTNRAIPGGMHIEVAAEVIARAAHGDDVGKYGTGPYIAEHVANVARVAHHIAPMNGVNPWLAEAAAWLHDVTEDTEWTIEQVEAALVRLTGANGDESRRVAAAVELLHHHDGVPRSIYLDRLSKDPIARVVKLADTLWNLSGLKAAHHAEKMADADVIRLSLKYSPALVILLP